jgi:HD-like signal output (HDOD) protein
VLKPIKANSLIPDVVAKSGLKTEEVEAVVSFYWKEIRKSLSSLKHSRVHASNLGDFVIKHWKMDDKILMLEKFEENNKLKGMQQITARFKTAETLFDLKNLKKIMDQEQQRQDFIKMHKKKTHANTREHNQGLEE